MKAVILAAGLGLRLRPLTDVLPKCMMPINGRPLLEYWLEALKHEGIDRVLVNKHHLPDIVQAWLDNSPHRQSTRTFHEPNLLGTGGTLLANRDFIDNDPVIIIHGDNLSLPNLKAFVRSHARRPAKTDITMMTFTSPNPEHCGIVEIDARGVVHDFHEKINDPPGYLANGAVYIFEPPVLEFMAGLDKEQIDLSTEVIPHFMGRINTFHNGTYHRDIGTIESLLTAQIEFSEAPPSPAGQDSWASVCGNNSDNIPEKLLQALAQAKNAAIYNLENGIPVDAPPDKNTWEKQAIILNVANPDPDLAELYAWTEQFNLPLEKILLFFPWVGAGFSSKTIFKEFGFRSLALCSC